MGCTLVDRGQELSHPHGFRVNPACNSPPDHCSTSPACPTVSRHTRSGFVRPGDLLMQLLAKSECRLVKAQSGHRRIEIQLVPR